jgi:hypothetical protein
MREIVGELEFIIENLCSGKDNVKRLKTQATHWEKLFAKDISNGRPLYEEHSFDITG